MRKRFGAGGASALILAIAAATLALVTVPANAWWGWGDYYYGQGPLGPPGGIAPCLTYGCGYPFISNIDGPYVIRGRGYGTKDNPPPRYGRW